MADEDFGIKDLLPLGGGLIGGIADVVGGLFGSSSSAKQAKRQMEFQERMSNTAYQRAVADMRAAGLNPILATKLGGASTPGGAMGQPPQLGGVGSAAVSTALAVRSQDAQIDLTKAQTEKTRVEAATLAGRQEHDIESARQTARKIAVEVDVNYEQALRIAMLSGPERDVLVQTLHKLREETSSARGHAAVMSVIEDYLSSPLGRSLRMSGIGAEDIKKMLEAGSSVWDVLLPSGSAARKYFK